MKRENTDKTGRLSAIIGFFKDQTDDFFQDTIIGL